MNELLPLLEHLRPSLVLTDPDGRIRFWNRGAERLFGWSAGEVLGRSIELLYRRAPPDGPDGLLAPVRSGHPPAEYVGEWIGVRRDGSEVAVHLRTVPVLRNGELLGVVRWCEERGARRSSDPQARLRESEWALVAAVSRALRSAPLERALQTVVSLAVPTLADWAWITLLPDAGTDGRIAIGGPPGLDAARFADRILRDPELHGGRDPVVVPELGRDPGSLAAELDLRALISVPLFAEEFGSPEGEDRQFWLGSFVLATTRRSGRVLTADDVRPCAAIGAWLGAAIRSAALAARAELDRARLQVESARNAILLRVGAAFAQERDVGTLVQLVTDEATALIGARCGAFYWNRADEQGEPFQLHTVSGEQPELFTTWRGTPLFGPGFRGWGPVRMADIRHDPLFEAYEFEPGDAPLVVSYLAVPVVTRSGEVLGGLFFGHPEPDRFDTEHEQLLVGVAAQAAVAFENARLVEALRASEARARAAAEAAKAADERKDAFLAMLGHELRNPLAPIKTALNYLRHVGDPRTIKQRRVIERQVDQLTRLVEDLLDVARITRGGIRLSLERVLIAEVVDRAVEHVRPAIEERDQQLLVHHDDPDLALDGDAARLTQVVSNLLINASRYTPPGGIIAIRTEFNGEWLRIVVRDNGRGIDPALLSRIFDVFVQGEVAIDRSEGGLGLGLAIVRSLVHLHGGEVYARSDGHGRGSEFVVELPVCDTMATTEEKPRAEATGGPRDLLVVDDNRDAADMLANLLTALGHQVRVAYDGPSAMNSFLEHVPEIALLDLGLPGFDGFELARRVRHNWGRVVRLVALSGYGQPSDRSRSAEAGFDAHLVKPVDLDELLEQLTEEPEGGWVEPDAHGHHPS